jgi:K+-transporting ATPase A subunit
MNSCEGFVEPGIVFLWVTFTIFITGLVVGLVSGLVHKTAEVERLKKEVKSLIPF